jgi:hypothetical protein
MRKRRKFTYSRTSPKNDKRGCLCPDGKTYSTDCCDGSLQAQGIGNITRMNYFLYTEEGEVLVQENKHKIHL